MLEVWEDDDVGLESVLSAMNSPDEDNAGPWTHFYDMHSGGGQKLDWSSIFVQAPYAEAVDWFADRYRDPYYVTCDCCGGDYSVSEYKTLDGATEYHRVTREYQQARSELCRARGAYDFQRPFTPEEEATLPAKHMSVQEYAQKDDVLIVYRRDM